MIRKSLWHMISTDALTSVAFAVIAATLGSLGVRNSSPVLSTVGGVSLFLLIYRLRYKRL
jgi:lipopolysaccharide export LptBFGC system permease protein LptF